MTTEYFQVIRGGRWQYGHVTVENGMVVRWAPGNNERLIDAHMITPWDGDVEGYLPRCETCDVWFISENMLRGHLDKTHGQGLLEMKAKRTEVSNALHAMRKEHEITGAKINALHASVLALDKDIAGKEEELAAAQTHASQPVTAIGRVSLG
jgi:hypothetical protein